MRLLLRWLLETVARSRHRRHWAQRDNRRDDDMLHLARRRGVDRTAGVRLRLLMLMGRRGRLLGLQRPVAGIHAGIHAWECLLMLMLTVIVRMREVVLCLIQARQLVLEGLSWL